MYFQMMRVISSPSISTTGLATLILAIEIPRKSCGFAAGRNAGAHAVGRLASL
jgi:hypothetical protein